jgi:hypothetical protein
MGGSAQKWVDYEQKVLALLLQLLQLYRQTRQFQMSLKNRTCQLKLLNQNQELF